MATSADGKPAHRRILVKLSGEALMGDEDFGIDPAFLRRLAGEIRAMREFGAEIAVVVGGGNLFRGAGLARELDEDAPVDRLAVCGCGHRVRRLH